MLSFCFRKLILVKKFVNKIYEIYFGVNMNICILYMFEYIVDILKYIYYILMRLLIYFFFYCIVSGIY